MMDPRFAIGAGALASDSRIARQSAPIPLRRDGESPNRSSPLVWVSACLAQSEKAK